MIVTTSTPPAIYAPYGDPGSSSTSTYVEGQYLEALEHFSAPVTGVPRLEVAALLKCAAEVAQQMPAPIRDEAASVFGTLSSELSRFDLDNLPPLTAVLPGDGSLMVEWALQGRRLGLSFSPNAEESGWFFVSSKNFGDVRAHGRLGAAGLRHLRQLLPSVLDPTK